MARQSWTLYRRNLGGLFLCFLPFFALTAVAFYVLVQNVELRADNFLLYLLGRDVFRLIVSSFGVGVAVILLADRLAGNPGSVRASFREAAERAPTIAMGALLASLPYLVTFFMLGPYMTPFLRELFVGPPVVITVLVLERQPLGAALGRARELLQTHWSRLLLYLITIAAGVGLLDFVIQQSTLRLLVGSVDALTYVLFAAVSVVIPSILLPFVACVWLIAYFDLRARAEDFDEPAMIALRTTPTEK